MPGADGSRPDLGRPRRVHIIGAGGSGMSAIASVLAAMGHRVSGSDANDTPALHRLAGRGVSVRAGHHPEVVAGAEIVVRSTAVPDSDPEVAAAGRLGLRVWRRADVLAAICSHRRTAAVSGTHGKTTTSSMLATVMRGSGLHPSFIVGGDIAGFGPGAAWDPAGEWFVVEADESDGTFVELGAEVAVVTSVEPDHLDYYGSVGAMEAAYRRFVEEPAGASVVCADDPGCRRVATGRARASLVTYGLDAGADVRVSDVALERFAASFTLAAPDGGTYPVRLQVPGLHNVRNAAGALAAAVAAGARWGPAVEAVGAYRGVARRFERRGERDGVTFVDGYDHLPTEVAAAIATARAGGWDRVVVVFQPHRYSRTEALWQEFGTAFDGADVVVVTGIYPAGEAPRPGVTGELVHRAVAAARPGADVRYVEDLAAVPAVLAGVLRRGDICLTLGAGDITRLPSVLLRDAGA